ncbi:MAG: formate dehydrogenase subunit delta [Gammaproteobacteria bacterium]|nr:formate dehydrogenase subunit delta [Gammaproteobacteria bacterium]MDD9958370.1 formate dehydrogenase subunit delta [Gammaproteobacteria bacterium]
MANQISDNLSHNDGAEKAAPRIADHMTRFWAPSMKAKIVKYAEEDGEALKESTMLAIQQISSGKR